MIARVACGKQVAGSVGVICTLLAGVRLRLFIYLVAALSGL